MVNLNANFFKILLGNPVGNIPAQVSWEILCAMLGVVLKNVPVAKFVWNIGEILKSYLGKLSAWDPGEPFEDTILGTLGEFCENFYLGKFCKILNFIWEKIVIVHVC